MQFCWDGQEPLEFSLIQDPSFVCWSHRLCSLQVKAMEVDGDERPKELVRKPYVLSGGCWPHSSRSSSCTVRPGKGPQMSSFYRWKKQPQREEGSCQGLTKLSLSLTGTFSVYFLNSSVWSEVKDVRGGCSQVPKRIEKKPESQAHVQLVTNLRMSRFV